MLYVLRRVFSGMLYPEFRNRRPPPSYTAAMQERRNELRRMSNRHIPHSPPPSYKSHASVLYRPGIHIIFPRNGEFPDSNPPTYRLTEPWSRPSLASFVDSFTEHNNGSDNAALRTSISSTQVLVEADYTNRSASESGRDHAADGVVNLSYVDTADPVGRVNDGVFSHNLSDSETECQYNNYNTEDGVFSHDPIPSLETECQYNNDNSINDNPMTTASAMQQQTFNYQRDGSVIINLDTDNSTSYL